MSIDYLNIILPKYIDDTKSLYNLLFICKSLYNRSSKIVERIKKCYPLEPHTRAKSIQFNWTQSDENYICEKMKNANPLNYRYIGSHFFTKEYADCILLYISNKYLHIVKQKIKKHDVVIVKNAYRYYSGKLYVNDAYFLYDGYDIDHLFEINLKTYFYDPIKINEIISVDEYNPRYYGCSFNITINGLMRFTIKLYPYKDEIIKNMVVHSKQNVVESCWKNGTIVFTKNSDGNPINKNFVIKYISSIQKESLTEVRYYDDIYEEAKQYIIYKKKNIIFIYFSIS